jgi:hypothetical protein
LNIYDRLSILARVHINFLSFIFPDQDGEKLNTVIKALEEEGYKCWTTTVGGPGIQQHSLGDRNIVIRTTS